MSLQYVKSLPDDSQTQLVETIERNTKRYIDVFSEVIDEIMPKESREIR